MYCFVQSYVVHLLILISNEYFCLRRKMENTPDAPERKSINNLVLFLFYFTYIIFRNSLHCYNSYSYLDFFLKIQIQTQSITA